MKALIFILLFGSPLFGLSQDFAGQENLPQANRPPNKHIEYAGFDMFQVWKSYLNECNQLVPDTVIQSGTVNVEYKPVMADGKISHFILAPIDTVWQKVECQDYKYDNGTRFYLSDSYIGGFGTPTINTYLSVTGNISYSTPEAKSKISITRKKICQIKKRKASWDDFWNRWCKEKKIIEFN